jgi:predicted dehydrogenase
MIVQHPPTTVALVGIGGYGDMYLRQLLDAGDRPATLVAAVEPNPERSGRLDELRRQQVVTFPSLAAMYESVTPELVVLATPLQLHADQTCLALGRGSHVLCEKPMAATPADAARMTAARDRSGRTLAIGYQWAFAPGVRQLKRDILDGRFGRPTRFRTRVYWPRPNAYYARNTWAGRLQTAEGSPVLDSPVSNACAHFVQNMLDLAGDAEGRADWPATVTAELYRAHAIENYDTAVIRWRTRGGLDMLAAVSHATERATDPTFELAFERATLTTGGADGTRIVARLAAGATVDYGPQPRGEDMDKLWVTVDAVRGGPAVPCGPDAAAAHTALVDAAQRSNNPVPFPPADVRTGGDAGHRFTFVAGLEAVLDRCYDGFALPSELRLPWARAGRPVEVAGPGVAP